MLIYSVFDYDTKSYSYYQAPGSPPRGQRSASGRGEHGLSPESLLAVLPRNAIPAGAGKEPHGIMARHGGRTLGGLPSHMGGIPLWAVALLGVGAWLYVRKK